MDAVGVDYPGSNGYIVVCIFETQNGARVYSDSSGTCIAVVLLNQQIGCTSGTPF